MDWKETRSLKQANAHGNLTQQIWCLDLFGDVIDRFSYVEVCYRGSIHR